MSEAVMRVLTCGGRDFGDREFLTAALDYLHGIRPVTLLIHGGASGADRMAGEWALSRGISVSVWPADWDEHGRAAGPIRNAQMLAAAEPELVVAFPGGLGTADMVRKAAAAGVEVWHPLLENYANAPTGAEE